MTAEFHGRVALVTGAGGAIGSATARWFAANGAQVALVDLAAERIDPLAAEIGTQAECATFAADQCDSSSVDRMVEAVARRFGRIDVLANIAGAWTFSNVADTTDDAWDRLLRLNLTGVFYTCRSALQLLRETGNSSIVNVASGAAFRPLPAVAAYAASKGGLVSFSRVLALEAAPKVRVNVVAPGPVETPTHLETAGDTDAAAVMQEVTSSGLFGRMATPDEVAEAIGFLSSSRARSVTGTTLHVNGGRYMP